MSITTLSDLNQDVMTHVMKSLQLLGTREDVLSIGRTCKSFGELSRFALSSDLTLYVSAQPCVKSVVITMGRGLEEALDASSLPVTVHVNLTWMATVSTVDDDVKTLSVMNTMLGEFFDTHPNMYPSGTMEVDVQGDIDSVSASAFILAQGNVFATCVKEYLRVRGSGGFKALCELDRQACPALLEIYVKPYQLMNKINHNKRIFTGLTHVRVHMQPVCPAVKMSREDADMEKFMSMLPEDFNIFVMCGDTLRTLEVVGAEYMSFRYMSSVLIPREVSDKKRVLRLDRLKIEDLDKFRNALCKRSNFRLAVSDKLCVDVTTERVFLHMYMLEDMLVAIDTVFGPDMTLQINMAPNCYLNPQALALALSPALYNYRSPYMAYLGKSSLRRARKLRVRLAPIPCDAIYPVSYFRDIMVTLAESIPTLHTICIQQVNVDANMEIGDYVDEEDTYGISPDLTEKLTDALNKVPSFRNHPKLQCANIEVMHNTSGYCAAKLRVER